MKGLGRTRRAQTNTERRLGYFPNQQTITYPASAANVLLPLTVANRWTPEVLICGGTYKTVNLDGNPATLSAKKYASDRCFRMTITTAGIKKGWATEIMPEARIMGDAIMLPDGKVMLVNGAKRGIAGYGNVPDTVGASNSDDPDYRPTLYGESASVLDHERVSLTSSIVTDPEEPAGKRFSTKNMPTSKFERLYHSSA